MDLEQMQKDAAENQTWVLRLIDAQMMAISVVETYAANGDHWKRARTHLGEAAFLSWDAQDEAQAVRSVFERAQLQARLETTQITHGARVRDLHQKWLDAMRRAVAPYEEFIAKWRKP